MGPGQLIGLILIVGFYGIDELHVIGQDLGGRHTLEAQDDSPIEMGCRRFDDFTPVGLSAQRIEECMEFLIQLKNLAYLFAADVVFPDDDVFPQPVQVIGRQFPAGLPCDFRFQNGPQLAYFFYPFFVNVRDKGTALGHDVDEMTFVQVQNRFADRCAAYLEQVTIFFLDNPFTRFDFHIDNIIEQAAPHILPRRLICFLCQNFHTHHLFQPDL